MGKGPFKMKGFGGFGNSPAKQDPSRDQGNEEEKKGINWGGVADVAVASLTGGLDAVYGSGKVNPGGKITFSKDKKKECTDDDGNVIACKD